MYKTRILTKLTNSYHLDGFIHFPKDYDSGITYIGAQIGLRQMKKYDELIENRIRNSKIYNSKLIASGIIKKPSVFEGSTFSHYPVLVEDKDQIRFKMRRKGIECGEVIQYSIPNLESYTAYSSGPFPVSTKASLTVINLPINYSQETTRLICDKFNEVIADIAVASE
jgi:dTDP-4-amino-4,6-dideoxygalactose transaminase